MNRAAFILVAVVFVSMPLAAADDPTYTALRSAKVDGRKVAVTNFTFERDAFRVTLNGTLHLLAPAGAKTFGAVFLGQGSYELTPVLEAEQRQLGLYANDEKLTTLTDTFDDAVFFASGLIFAAQQASAAQSGAPDARANDVYDDYLKRQRKDLHTNVHVRILQELLNGRSEPLFYVSVDGQKHPPAVLVVDPRGWGETLRIDGMGGEQTVLWVPKGDRGGFWYSSRLRSEVETGQGVVIRRAADAEHYLVDAKIQRAELSGTTTMTFTPGVPALRVLAIDLAPKLRITEAAFAAASAPDAWTPVAWIQEEHDEDPDAGVVFPAALEPGKQYLLKVTYGGREVLEDAGDGNFTVLRRTSWYPNVGTFEDPANFELRFRTPEKFQIISVGSETENSVIGSERVAVWKTSAPIRVAGFNYGRFKKLSQTDPGSGMTIDVYTNPGTPQIINEINRMLEAMAMSNPEETVAAEHVSVNAAELAQAAMADGVNTARTGNIYFGPLADKRVSITQQAQWFFGQSWPSLIYMPFIAFLDGTTRNTLGLNSTKDFIDSVGAHEFAHQWWGHQVGWRGYRDQWLSEGFSEFTSALVMQQSGGWNAYNAFWERARKNIVVRGRGATRLPFEAGPMTQGWRLETWQTPGAYDAIVYSKGAYVLHMLRMTMQDRTKKNADEAFMAMMTDFATKYAGKNPSTLDFQRVVEKHATPSLKLTQDGKLDWFFRQWVYGTAIPKYTSKLDFQDAGGGKYRIRGSVTQSEVPNDFAVVMPVYVHFDKTNFAELARVPIVGSSTKEIDFEIALPKKPQKVSVNAMHDILAR